MAKIYNEIVIDMNPESSTFEETLYEDSFEYSGDMMLGSPRDSKTVPDVIDVAVTAMKSNPESEPTQGGVPPSTQPDADEYLSQVGQNSIKYEEKYYYYYSDGFREIDPSTSPNFDEAYYKDVTDLMEGFEDRNLSLSERGLGMGDVQAEEMLDMTEDKMLDWIIDTRYGGQLPENITENDLRMQIRTKLPQKGGVGTTDWYGLQDDASKVGAQAAQAYGSGMGASMRGAIAGQKDIQKDVYKLQEDKGKDWTSKFRTFLSSLPSATGT